MDPLSFLRAAHKLMELGDYSQAESLYTDLILKGVEHIEVYNNRGSARYALGKYKKAIQDYSAAIQLNPRVDYPHFNRANCKIELGDLLGAIRDYERALQFNPGHGPSHLNRAIAYQKKGDHLKALADFELALGLIAENRASIYEYRSESLFSLEREKEALEDLAKVLEERSSDKDLIYRISGIYLEREAFKEALDLSTYGLTQFPHDSELLLQRVEIYVAAGAPALAWNDLQRISVDQVKERALYFFLKGKILDSLNKLPEAIIALEESLEIDPRHMEGWILLGALHLKNREYDKVLKVVKEAKMLDYHYPESYLLSAKAQYERGKYFATIADLEMYENRGGSLAEAWVIKGFAQMECKSFEQASLDFGKAIRLNPELADAYLGQGNAFLARSQYAKALDGYDKALEIAPDFRAAHFNRGVALKHLGKPQSAIKAWEKAADLHHPKAETYLRRYR